MTFTVSGWRDNRDARAAGGRVPWAPTARPASTVGAGSKGRTTYGPWTSRGQAASQALRATNPDAIRRNFLATHVYERASRMVEARGARERLPQVPRLPS